MILKKLIEKYDSAVDEEFIGFTPECTPDVLYVLDIRNQIRDILDGGTAAEIDLEQINEIDSRLKKIARETITSDFHIPEGVKSEDWWTQLDKQTD